jgi:hypothetical protein
MSLLLQLFWAVPLARDYSDSRRYYQGIYYIVIGVRKGEG